MLVVQRLACSSTSTPCNARSGDAGGANLALAYQAATGLAPHLSPDLLAQALEATPKRALKL